MIIIVDSLSTIIMEENVSFQEYRVLRYRLLPKSIVNVKNKQTADCEFVIYNYNLFVLFVEKVVRSIEFNKNGAVDSRGSV